jgi:hypothetical protein
MFQMNPMDYQKLIAYYWSAKYIFFTRVASLQYLFLKFHHYEKKFLLLNAFYFL